MLLQATTFLTLSSISTIFLFSSFETAYSYNYFINDLLYGSVNWLYSYVETLSIFNLIFYTVLTDYTNYSDYYSFSLLNFVVLLYDTEQYNFSLFYSVLLDSIFKMNLLKTWFNDEWYNAIFSFLWSSNILSSHAELLYLPVDSFFYLIPSKLKISIYTNVLPENFFLPVLLFPQFLFSLFCFSFFISFYFSFFSTATKEENSVDSDFLLASFLVEAEKEITALDDILMGIVIVIYIFFWFFYIHCWTLFNLLPELSAIFYLFPFLWIIVLGVPTFLLYDFGIYYIAYLRGVAPSSIMTAELLFDYIYLFAFFFRLLVQGVRIVLMTLTYAGLHDFVLFFLFEDTIFFVSDNILSFWNRFEPSGSTISFYLLGSLPLHFFHWLYELFHTFFVVIAQTTAFFAIAFWLFLFLYTFFVLEKQENYFEEKRAVKKKALQDILELKQNF